MAISDSHAMHRMPAASSATASASSSTSGSSSGKANSPGQGTSRGDRSAAISGGRHSLLREPLYLDRCVVAADPAWQSYFEVQELHHTTISSSNTSNMTNNTQHNNNNSHLSSGGGSYSGNATYIFRAEDDAQTRMWYKQLQYYAQGMGAWRRRRNALPNIMIAGLGLR